MLLDNKCLANALEILYEAPLDPSQWQAFLNLTAQTVEAQAAALLLHDFADVQAFVARRWSSVPEESASSQNPYGELKAWLEAVTRASSWLGPSRQVVVFDELQGTEFFADLLHPFTAADGIFAAVEPGPLRIANLMLYFRGESHPRRQELEFVRLLCPHIKRAYRLHSQLSGSRNQRASLRSALDSLTMGVILLASKGQVVTLNHAAEQFLAEPDGLLMTEEGLRARRADDSVRLTQLIEETIAQSEDQGTGRAGLIALARPDRPALLLLISPVQGFDVDESHPVRAIVFVSDPAQRVRPTHATLRALFGLTPAEYRVAMLLSDGRKPAEIAETVGVSRNTLKSQLSGIYRKTGASHQAQLVRLLLQLPTSSAIKNSAQRA